MNLVESLCFKYINVTLPDSYFKIIWDLIVMTVLIVNITFIPLRVAFKINISQNAVATIIMDRLPIYIFIFEIMINFKTAFY